MRPILLLTALLASYPSSTLCDDAIAITAPEAQPQLQTAAAEPFPFPAIQARQHIVAARTTSPIPTSITTLPTSAPASDDGDDGGSGETSNSGSAENTSTTTVTITSRSTTTIRPTLTITSLFSSISPLTSGASGRLESLLLLPWRFMYTLFVIFS
ncbi:hypothetical protein O1611_g6777 [Lasiodiplodia mahajangana]|uniref:Uncharacterized protein n=1 Tax=Lasiodiplodia mahajangana TaxID=1108764 RepID=A0ACC2JH77_9PEZI|nr:hypothetical protein O1611_g6777 [Lasiodiplodia mahajangana]